MMDPERVAATVLLLEPWLPHGAPCAPPGPTVPPVLPRTIRISEGRLKGISSHAAPPRAQPVDAFSFVTLYPVESFLNLRFGRDFRRLSPRELRIDTRVLQCFHAGRAFIECSQFDAERMVVGPAGRARMLADRRSLRVCQIQREPVRPQLRIAGGGDAWLFECSHGRSVSHSCDTFPLGSGCLFRCRAKGLSNRACNCTCNRSPPPTPRGRGCGAAGGSVTSPHPPLPPRGTTWRYRR